jgi:ParB family chromosome partitioning protein
MPKPRAALGRGLNALIPGSMPAPAPDPTEGGADSLSQRAAVLDVPVADIQPNPQQPRHEFALDALQELTDSVREHGIIQPLIVTSNDAGSGYYLIAGERRWRAAKAAGLESVPVIVKEANPEAMLALALVENIQRADLNPLEEAQAYRELMDTFNLSPAEVARRVGRSRSTVANLVRLLNLPPEIINAMHGGLISEGHARAIFALDGKEAQIAMLERVVAEGYSVRQTEEMVRRSKEGLLDPEPEAPLAPATPVADDQPVRRAAKPTRRPADLETSALENNFRAALNTKVQLSRTREGGRLVIHFYSEEMLDRLYRTLVGEDE